MDDDTLDRGDLRVFFWENFIEKDFKLEFLEQVWGFWVNILKIFLL